MMQKTCLVNELTTTFEQGSELITALWTERLMDDHLWAERVRCHWVVNIPNTNFILATCHGSYCYLWMSQYPSFPIKSQQSIPFS